jgi:glycosyltransferase involved in cell wall biosynthesis
VFAQLERTQPKVHLVFVGRGSIQRRTIGQADNRNLNRRVHFVGEVSDVMPFLSASDVFLLTSDTEGTPGAMLEAMAMGLPVVSTAVGGIPEVVRDDAGLLAAPEDEERLSDSLGLLVDDEKLRAKLGSIAKARVQSQFSLDSVTRKFLDLYQSVAS